MWALVNVTLGFKVVSEVKLRWFAVPNIHQGNCHSKKSFGFYWFGSKLHLNYFLLLRLEILELERD
eukprot:snap_masked-scaffold_39-processed-gene-2.68-mRNA-1 protein AED:1.00 eAED:1.00 QI:0/0/0/0/1/1/2/0/65